MIGRIGLFRFVVVKVLEAINNSLILKYTFLVRY
jgi:hypothetical protein